ncbi:YlaH-like family protein [Halobacillus naozhouensis]|uniref:YlaH-like family protein n=1 Tax=Halobacillus naozhouensis TaxID=554880 RepID=A0ABY8J275_9BACI|nr:YlaH-like family protein [Halobacillus naozhouensis]WFT76604.1 YlaH-like family protein [Halobacillus naozhouensis]
MENTSTLTVPADLWPVADFFFRGLGSEVNLDNEAEVAVLFRSFFLLYLTVVALAIATFKLGFARKLPLAKSIVVYAVLVVGTFILTLILGLNLPIAESLMVAALILGVYRLRLHKERSGRESRQS